MTEHKPPSILTIEDEKSVRISIRHYLEDCDYHVLEADDGKAGLDIFEKENPDLVLVDLRMPHVDGLQVLDKIHHASPDTPVIVISGTGSIRDVVEALHLGAWDYLIKPIEDLTLLRLAVEKAMERSSLVRQNRIYQERLESLVKEKTAELHRLNEELEQRVRTRTAELEVAKLELESFNYSVSHDLRAPLRRINGFSEILLRDHKDRLDVEGKDCLNRVMQNILKMNDLIDDLLRLSQVTQQEMEIRKIDLSGLVRQTAGELVAAEGDRKIECIVAENLRASGDEQLLKIVMQNLLGNALKYSSKKISTRIEFGATEARGGRAFFVRDNGAGFDMEHKEKLFAVFQRLHSESEFAGHGVGLSIVQRIISKHNGSIWAESEEGKGATFFFTLP
ncbi:MAG: response regulator [Planctomycetota bacterium]